MGLSSAITVFSAGVCTLSAREGERVRHTSLGMIQHASRIFCSVVDGGGWVKEVFICLKITQVLSSDKGYGIFITCLTLNEEITTVVKNPMNSRVSAQRPLIEGQIEAEWKLVVD